MLRNTPPPLPADTSDLETAIKELQCCEKHPNAPRSPRMFRSEREIGASNRVGRDAEVVPIARQSTNAAGRHCSPA